jgi:signal transduction histidine kinase/DNA-binding LacI/PurR family transcriptional regulator/AraC-like DNA-binding protein
MCQAAEQHDANLVYIAGGHFESASEAVLYSLIDAQSVDGVISWVAFVGSDTETGDLGAYRTFLQRYRPRPVLNIGWTVPGFHNLCFDNLQGMRAAIDHLVKVHGCRRIAYYGLESASTGLQIRYQAFEQAMSEIGRFDPALTSHDPAQLIDRARHWPGRDYEAVIAEGDDQAAHLIRAFESRGVRIPEDVMVVGFHDGQEARLVSPPLTTVHMPYREMGRRAVTMVLDAVAGHEMPGQAFVPLELTVRRSCSCREALISEAAGSAPGSRPLVSETRATEKKHVLDAIGDALVVPEPRDQQRLWDAFIDELDRSLRSDQSAPAQEGFLYTLEQMLIGTQRGGEDIAAWQRVISTMRRALLPHLCGPQIGTAEDVWHQARVLISQAAASVQRHETWQDDRRRQILHEIQSDLLVTCALEELVEILAGKLPRLGISRCYLALYGDPEHVAGEKRLILAYNERGRIELAADGEAFAHPALFPPCALHPSLRHSLIVNALCIGSEQIGYLGLEMSLRPDTREDVTCDILRRQISSAFKGVTLRQQAIVADRLKSRFLSMVSHELRTPLNLLVSLSELTMEEVVRLREGQDDRAIARLTHYHQQILNSAQHLDHLILDVLDLARSQVEEMTLNRTHLDLGEVLLEAAVIGESLARQKQLDWQFNVSGDLPPVHADRTRLRQVLLNLLNNAVKFTASGHVALQARVQDDQITVSVRDTGLGIPPEDHQAIFDEFQQSERTVSRGHRGMGLGLAISRRLIELHGGTIGVLSSGKEGLGSTFYFTLPVAGEQRVEAATGRSDVESVLLLTRDHRASQDLRQHLRQRGFAIETLVLDGLEHWLDRVLAARPNAVILDGTLASEHGWSIAKALKEHPSTEQIPVVLYSLVPGGQTGSVVEIDYLAKDASISDLARALRRYGLHHPSEAETKSVLIVDDDPAFLELYHSIIQQHLPGCEIMRAQDGQVALQALCQRLPDLILLDLLMPKMSGFEFLERMRAQEGTRSIPVIVLTGQTLSEGLIARLNQGVGAILNKGVFSPQETLTHIETALSRGKAIGDEAQRLVRRAMAWMHARFAEPISCAKLAESLHVSQDHLIRCFREEFGLTPVVYLKRWRIQQAKEMLETTDKSVTAVALAAGFSSQSYFSRVFKAQVGVSPTAYRSGERGFDLAASC